LQRRRSPEDVSERIKAVIRARHEVPDSDAARERAELIARIVDGLLPLSAEQVSALRTLLGPIRPGHTSCRYRCRRDRTASGVSRWPGRLTNG